MIEKLKQTVRGFDDKPAMPTAIEFFNKINEIIDTIYDMQLAISSLDPDSDWYDDPKSREQKDIK